jgi:hypothetical protein
LCYPSIRRKPLDFIDCGGKTNSKEVRRMGNLS